MGILLSFVSSGYVITLQKHKRIVYFYRLRFFWNAAPSVYLINILSFNIFDLRCLGGRGYLERRPHWSKDDPFLIGADVSLVIIPLFFDWWRLKWCSRSRAFKYILLSHFFYTISWTIRCCKRNQTSRSWCIVLLTQVLSFSYTRVWWTSLKNKRREKKRKKKLVADAGSTAALLPVVHMYRYRS